MEDSTSGVLMSFTDPETGDPITPSSGNYRVDTDDGTSIRAVTAISGLAASDHYLRLDPSDNAIQDTTKEFEEHVVTVEIFYGSAPIKEQKGEWRYQVKNLSYVPLS